jgi:hypothetical protein
MEREGKGWQDKEKRDKGRTATARSIGDTATWTTRAALVCFWRSSSCSRCSARCCRASRARATRSARWSVSDSPPNIRRQFQQCELFTHVSTLVTESVRQATVVHVQDLFTVALISITLKDSPGPGSENWHEQKDDAAPWHAQPRAVALLRADSSLRCGYAAVEVVELGPSSSSRGRADVAKRPRSDTSV